MKRSTNLSGKGVLITVFAILEVERNVKLNALKADVSKYRKFSKQNSQNNSQSGAR